MWLSSNKALLTNTGSKLDLDRGYNLLASNLKEGEPSLLSSKDSRELLVSFLFLWTSLTGAKDSMDSGFPLWSPFFPKITRQM